MTSTPRWTGILLAAGRGRRFDASGQRDKLLQKLADSKSVAQHSAQNLLAAMPQVVAVLRPDNAALSDQLQAMGVECLVCHDADAGMANSLKHALRTTADSAGWLIALADMPAVKPSTMTLLFNALQAGAEIVVPVYQRRRGNPVGFAHQYLPQLLDLQGDVGARSLLQSNPVTQVEVDDPGIHQDIDTQDALLNHLHPDGKANA
ncbi:nucleotidyltransferase family protein [Undibacterium sp. Ji83W]|uniref:nucleotidyltransferase family protein n=1 Tax=Undibacterium sp. Ji83W TaxID=3413043 RepID=UPI003BF3C32B